MNVGLMGVMRDDWDSLLACNFWVLRIECMFT